MNEWRIPGLKMQLQGSNASTPNLISLEDRNILDMKHVYFFFLFLAAQQKETVLTCNKALAKI